MATFTIPNSDKSINYITIIAGLAKYSSMLPNEKAALFPKRKWTRESCFCEKDVLGKNSLHDCIYYQTLIFTTHAQMTVFECLW